MAIAHRSDWDWFWTAKALASVVPGEEQVRWLTAADTDEINAVLTVANPDTSTWPSDDRARRWAGIRTSDGQLAAVLADTSRNAAIAHISSVATAPDHRRNGYGAALTAWATRGFLDDSAELVTLGMYADNDDARRLYEGLGFTCSHQFTAALLERAA